MKHPHSKYEAAINAVVDWLERLQPNLRTEKYVLANAPKEFKDINDNMKSVIIGALKEADLVQES